MEWWERDGVMNKSYTYLGEAYLHQYNCDKVNKHW